MKEEKIRKRNKTNVTLEKKKHDTCKPKTCRAMSDVPRPPNDMAGNQASTARLAVCDKEKKSAPFCTKELCTKFQVHCYSADSVSLDLNRMFSDYSGFLSGTRENVKK